MKSSSKLLAGLILTLLGGCTPAERAAMLAFTPDQAPKPTKHRQVNARHESQDYEADRGSTTRSVG